MSEEILKALMQLFALIVKQDGGMTPNEREYVSHFLDNQLNPEDVADFLEQFDSHAGDIQTDNEPPDNAPPSVKDSVRILGICKKINRTLNQQQKIVVLLRLYELVNADKQFTLQRMNIINTVAEVFNVGENEFNSIESFVKFSTVLNLDHPRILFLTANKIPGTKRKHLPAESFHDLLIVLHVPSVNLFFLKHNSKDQLFLNGLPLKNNQVYLLAKGASLRLPQGKPVYYSDIASSFRTDKNLMPLSFTAENLTYRFPSGDIGLHDIHFQEQEGKLIGIMGASGTGKTTLLNLLSGVISPSAGKVTLNGIDIHRDSRKLEGAIGYIPQDDLLIEELTVFDNLYFCAKQSFDHLSKKAIVALVEKTLQNLGLYEKKDLRVGSPLNKVISGGQRKRLNIALELIREPSVLFVDEPTSGLSSRDSENVMDLLRELTLRGKLIFVVIHQPSSDIFKMFDNMIILDQGGRMVYYGNPIESVVYFKTLDAQINSNVGECSACGNVNPETIFSIIETQVVDEYGQYTGKRKMKPADWFREFEKRRQDKPVSRRLSPPQSNLVKPNWFKQFRIYGFRDSLSKISNRQYLFLSLLEAPVLGFILSYLIRYIADPSSNEYVFWENENIPIYIFMTLIVALFLGLTFSAEEIFKDRKILRREKFLHLSRSSYLLSKAGILLVLSGIQALLFLLVANPLLGLKGMMPEYWLAFFTTAVFGNLLGLNISSAFNSAITIYILIPLVMIPMMILSGAMFPFDKLNRSLGSAEKVPFIAEMMATRWTYEALMVTQFKDNAYEKHVYPYEQVISTADFQTTFAIPRMRDALNQTIQEYNKGQLSNSNEAGLPLLRNELPRLAKKTGLECDFLATLNGQTFQTDVVIDIREFLAEASDYYTHAQNQALHNLDRLVGANKQELDLLKQKHHNESLSYIVKKTTERNRLLVYKDRIIQQFEPIYLEPDPEGFLSFRTHFYAPAKWFLGKAHDTFIFNIIFVWHMTLILYLTLYFDLLAKAVRFFENIKLKRK